MLYQNEDTYDYGDTGDAPIQTWQQAVSIKELDEAVGIRIGEGDSKAKGCWMDAAFTGIVNNTATGMSAVCIIHRGVAYLLYPEDLLEGSPGYILQYKYYDGCDILKSAFTWEELVDSIPSITQEILRAQDRFFGPYTY